MRQQLQARYTELQELVKDLRETLLSVPDTQIFEFKGQYISGMTLPLKQCPRAIELIRCVNLRAPGTVTNHGSVVEWIWTATGAKVLRIDGLTASQTPYIFTFRSSY